jgi:hypothetical protein
MPDQDQDTGSLGSQPPATATAPDPAIQQTQQATATQAATPAPQADPGTAAKIAHTHRLGQIAQHLFTGSHDEYSVGSDGKMQATTVTEKPGQMFRNLMASALLGMAASSTPTTDVNGRRVQGQDFGSGIGAGVGAAIGLKQRQDDQRYDRAQQDFKNRQTAEKQDQSEEKIQTSRMLAHAQQERWNLTELNQEATANHRGLELLQKENSLSMRKLAVDEKAGGIPAAVKDNDEPGNGAEMMKRFTSSPKEFEAPAGYTRSITKEYSLEGLKYDYKNNGWEDEHGNATNLEDHTTWHVRFVPEKNEPQEFTGKELSRYFPDVYGGRVDPNKTYQLNQHDFTAVAEKQAGLAHQDFLDNFRKTHEAIATTLAQGRNRLGSLNREYEAATRNGDDQGAARIQDQIDTLNDQLENSISQADPHVRSTLRDAVSAPLPAEANPQPTAAPAGTPTTPGTKPAAFIRPPKPGAPLSQGDAQKYLARAGGDKEKARKLALADGWSL